MSTDDDDMPLAAPRVDVAPDGRLSVPAHDVTALLRSLARSWAHSTRDGAPVRAGEGRQTVRLEPATVQALAGTLEQIADELDVQFIGVAGRTPPPPPPSADTED
ncbi:hypothetical protein ABZ820_22825 [Streptomyces diacarni]|uniref:Uncharacterized protein n=1 Tax=Streptomyces diacarni TaxID=2800381 RepID=A0A367EN94_9ACTN|nr:hypothetical protein [Streptomyces diacarni]RCG19443.1 hypothetical protein DTL70_21915 [Streptomyces diacarni]